MKIDENTINHNAMLLIGNEALKIGSYDFADSELEIAKNFSYAAISYINGVLDMAVAMKEVLKAN